ncbi:MAG TPA: phage major capsid protein, partial [Alphaproteobacteria bacterium]|nr:phage major capsid protein [Alphaproteobacteria bacterium]
MSSTEVTAMIDSVNRAFDAFKAANDERLKQIEKRQEDVVTAEKVDRLNDQITEGMKAIDALNVKLAQRVIEPGGRSETPEASQYRKAFGHYFRTGEGDKELNALAIKAGMTVQSDPGGGFLAPPEVDTMIGRVQSTVSSMRALAQVINIGGNSYKKVFNTGGTGSGWVGETSARPETATPALSEMNFPAMQLYANPAATQDLLDDALIDVESWLAGEVVISFAEKEGAAFITGDGAQKPFGVLSVPTVADASWAWGKLGFIKTGANGDFAATNPSDNLLTLIYQLKQGYRANAAFIMNRTVQATVRKFKDSTGQYLWQPSLQAGQPPSLMGYPLGGEDKILSSST